MISLDFRPWKRERNSSNSEEKFVEGGTNLISIYLSISFASIQLTSLDGIGRVGLSSTLIPRLLTSESFHRLIYSFTWFCA